MSRGPLHYISDPSFYRIQGILLANGHGFAAPFTFVEHHTIVPTAFHPPMMSVFLGAVTWLGFDGLTSARVATALVGTATVVLIGLLGRAVGGNRVGLIAGTIAAINPNLWVPDAALSSESLAAAFVAGALTLTYRVERSARLGAAFGLGILIGLSALTRPELLALAPLLALPAALHSSNETRRRAAIILVVITSSIAVVTPWMLRSATLFEQPVLFSTNGRSVLGYANCPLTYGGPSLGSWRIDCVLTPATSPPGTPGKNALDESEVSRRVSSAGIKYLRSHPATFLTRVVWARIGRTWSVFRPFDADEARSNEAKSALEMTSGVLILWASLAFAVVGVWPGRRQHRRSVWPLLAPCVIVTIVSVFAYGTPRFRVVAEPSIAVLAALGVEVVLRRMSRRAPAGVS